MLTPPRTISEVFYSYAHSNEALLNELIGRLSILQRQGYIQQWHDRQIIPGKEWAADVDVHLNAATLILLLISPAFTQSQYCLAEMKRALERHTAKEACTVAILLSPTPIEKEILPIADLEHLPARDQPLTTWGNRDEAFYLILKGVRRTIEQWLDPASAWRRIWNVPFIRNTLFTGREDVLSLLHDTFHRNAVKMIAQPLALSGVSGIGKTQLAVEYAYRFFEEYRTVLWVDASSSTSLNESFVVLAGLLDVTPFHINDAQAAMQDWLDTHDEWLLILDDVQDELALQSLLYSENGHTLLTTQALGQVSLSQEIEVMPMTRTEGTVFLLAPVPASDDDTILHDVTPAKYRVAEQLVHEFGGLPLALDQARATMQEHDWSVTTYLRQYQMDPMRLLHVRGQAVNSHPIPVATTWISAFEKIRQQNPHALELLRFCSFLSADAIPEELFTLAVTELDPQLKELASNLLAWDEAVELLRTFSLLRHNAAERMFSMHRLVQTILRHEMNEAQQRRQAERVVRAIAHIFPDPKQIETASLCQRYLPQAQVCATLILHWQMNFAAAGHLLSKTALCLQKRAEYIQAEQLLHRALAIFENLYGTSHLLLYTIHNDLAKLYYMQGAYEQAERLLLRILTQKETMPPNASLRAISLSHLGQVYEAQGNDDQAERCYLEALETSKMDPAIPPTDHTSTLSNLAELYTRKEQHNRAEFYYKRISEISEQALGPLHPNVFTHLLNLANCYDRQKKFDEARALYRRVNQTQGFLQELDQASKMSP